MNNYDLAAGPRARPSHGQGIPDYAQPDYGQQQQYQDQGRDYSHQYAPQGSYYVEDDSHYAVPLSPEQSHYARQDQYGSPPARPPRPDQYAQERTASPQQRRHDMYQQFFQAGAPHHGNGQWNGSGYTVPGAQSYPPPRNLHALINQLQKRAPLGPPPSARRGPSSYYQQETPVVHPIAEEADSTRASTRHGSTRSASSINGFAMAPQQYFDDGSSSIYSGVPSMPPPAHIAHPEDDIPITPGLPRAGPSQRESPLRQASFGMTTRPVMTTVRSSDKLRKDTLSPDGINKREFPLTGLDQREKQSTPDGSDIDTPERRRPQLYPRSLGASSDALGALSVHMDPSASESDLTDTKSEKHSRRSGAARSSKTKPPMIPLAYRNTPADDEDVITPLTPSSKFRNGKKRPPNLNIEAVREAEQRGSLTSLPDLIMRATRLASNLDRGKTASRLGMSAWLGDNEKGSEKLKMQTTSSNNTHRSAGSLTDMLASFPPPAIGTPPRTRDGSTRKHSFNPWSSNLRNSTLLPSDSDLSKEHRSHKAKKRCCGLPLWLIVLLFAIGICLVAAAVIIPIVLVVVPEQRNSQVTANTTSICQQRYGCQNGGSSIVSSQGNCQCLCINGFTGATCTDQDRSGCYTVNLGSASNVTVGSAIPRIISDAYANFSISLDSSALLGLFSSSSLSCTSENALITFNGLAQRDVATREAQSTSDGSATSNGIVYASGSPTTATTMSTVTSSAPAATSSVATGRTAQATMDFARTVVLYMFQATGQLSSAIAAQQNFQNWFSAQSGSLASANSLGLGSGYSADLSTYKLMLANGTVVGGGSGHQ